MVLAVGENVAPPVLTDGVQNPGIGLGWRVGGGTVTAVAQPVTITVVTTTTTILIALIRTLR